jgi:ubiquinone/menaquinone biosynthesis C-methylase UbiE
VSLGDRIAPFLLDTLGRAHEKKPLTVEHRTRLLSSAEGSVLEIGVGTGFNFPYYPAAVSSITATDPVDGMLTRARRRAAGTGTQVTTARASAEALPFEDESFDTVVASLVLCSVDDQDRALAEIRRVLRPGGRYLFMEHVRSDDPALARKQDRLERVWKTVCFGCHPNRDTLPRIESAFTVEEVERGEVPGGMPKIVRPFVLGRAVRSR